MSVKNIAKDSRLSNSLREAAQLERLIEELSEIRTDMLTLEADAIEKLLGLNTVQRDSAKNLVHYMALRRRDIRQLQQMLATLGLSSLGRAEAHVKSNIESILKVLCTLTSKPDFVQETTEHSPGLVEGNALLEAHTAALLGAAPEHRKVRIMVTMPSEAAEDYHLIHSLLINGMDCMRINCAYDSAQDWSRMITNLRRAMKKTGKDCRILMDLSGPKLRTGSITPGPQVIKWRPQRDQFGQVKTPARILLIPVGCTLSSLQHVDACLPVPGEWLKKLKHGDLIKFFDSRGASRFMNITGVEGEARRAESNQTVYIATGTRLSAYHNSNPKSEGIAVTDCNVGEIPAIEQYINLKKHDELILTRSQLPGRLEERSERGQLLKPARIGVTLPCIFDDVRVGERVLFDEGKIGGVIKSVGQDEIRIEITHAREQGEKLRADKGINLPDSNLHLPPLTEKDNEDLVFVAKHADLVGYSFVRTAADVSALQRRLNELGGNLLGIVLKIETQKAFEELPNLLLAAMRSPCAGVMIARGDLAVECGYERLAEIQEEILWICEAAHMPVIWATQVLENLAKDGQPSRAEVTDAAMGERAECVMLNKGPYIMETVQMLEDILQRMQEHQTKKRSMLRQLRLADHLALFD